MISFNHYNFLGIFYFIYEIGKTLSLIYIMLYQNLAEQDEKFIGELENISYPMQFLK